MDNLCFGREYKVIPTQLTEIQFNQFVLPPLSKGKRGPATKLSFYKLFCYILILLYTGMQWQSLPIKNNVQGQPEIHHSRIHRIYQRWASDGSLQRAFEASIQTLAQHQLVDVAILHGDDTSTDPPPETHPAKDRKNQLLTRPQKRIQLKIEKISCDSG